VLLILLVVLREPYWNNLLPLAVAEDEDMDGPISFAKGKDLFKQAHYEQAAVQLWKAVILHGSTPPERQYNVQDVFQLFLQCYMAQGRIAEGFAFVASESFRRGQIDMGRSYYQQALEIDANNPAVRALEQEFPAYVQGDTVEQHKHGDSEMLNNDLIGKTPEELYSIASKHFSDKDFEKCADVFEISCMRSGYKLGPSCANAVYCRSMIVDFGFNGTQFLTDMERITSLTREEANLFRLTALTNEDPFAWRRATSVHPHMVCVLSRNRVK
jgi:tetratricopeptide (TPR) repeat protein